MEKITETVINFLSRAKKEVCKKKRYSSLRFGMKKIFSEKQKNENLLY